MARFATKELAEAAYAVALVAPWPERCLLHDSHGSKHCAVCQEPSRRACYRGHVKVRLAPIG